MTWGCGGAILPQPLGQSDLTRYSAERTRCVPHRTSRHARLVGTVTGTADLTCSRTWRAQRVDVEHHTNGNSMSGETSTNDQATDADPPGRRFAALAVFLLVAFAAGGIGSITQGADVDVRYLALERPVWAPPSFLFGIVWPVLYLLIGVAAWRVWRAAGDLRAASTALGLWLAQLVVNAVWPGVFFGLEAFGPAIAIIVLLDILVVATIVAFARHDRLAAWLLVPYLVWILYATALNISLQILN